EKSLSPRRRERLTTLTWLAMGTVAFPLPGKWTIGLHLVSAFDPFLPSGGEEPARPSTPDVHQRHCWRRKRQQPYCFCHGAHAQPPNGALAMDLDRSDAKAKLEHNAFRRDPVGNEQEDLPFAGR